MKISRNLKNKMIEYVRQYAERITQSKNEADTINAFDSTLAAAAAIKALGENRNFESEAETIGSEGFKDYLVDFFDEKLLVNYLAIKRNIGYYEAKSLLTDKGLDFFTELKGVKNDFYKKSNNDYPATDNQIKYIVAYGVRLTHANELSGREASLIISCLKNNKKTKPNYYSYYIKCEPQPLKKQAM